MFRETNEHEGESWTFWLERDGNEEALLALQTVVEDARMPYDYPYELNLSESLEEDQVNVLCSYSEAGYFYGHNKVVGTLVIPEGFAVDDLYKGGVQDLFRA